MDIINLSYPQKNILAMQRFYPETAIGNQCIMLISKKHHDIALLEKAVIQTIRMRDTLRLRMTADDRQYVSDEVPAHIKQLSFGSEEEAERFCRETAMIPLTAADAPQSKIYLFSLNGKEGIIMCFSHMTADAMTSAIIALTIEERYAALTEDPDAAEVPVPSYADLIRKDEEYPGSKRFSEDKKFWEQLYKTAPCATPINARVSSSPAADRLEYSMSDRAEQALNTICDACNVTPAVVFEAAVTAYLSRLHPDNGDVTVAIPVHNRIGSIVKDTAGMRVLTVPLTLPVNTELSLREWVRHTGRYKRDAVFRHGKYPLQCIQEHLRSLGFMGRLYHVMVNYHAVKIPDIAEVSLYSCGASECALCIHIDDRFGCGRHTLTFDHQTEIFPDPEELILLGKRIEHIMEQTAEHPSMKISEMEIVPPAEKRLLESFNDTAEEIPSCCVHTLFRRTAEKNPDRTAVIFHDKEITYRELDRISEVIAGCLDKRNAAGSIIGIMSERCPEMLAAMLGILKAGAAFMLTDPSYPDVRIRQMIEDTGCRLMITDREISRVECLGLSSFDINEKVSRKDPETDASSLCYVVFTSGSTGKPKGTGITHRNTVNYISPGKKSILGGCIPYDQKKILCITNPVFDIFITETLLPLANGMTVILADEREGKDPVRAASLMREHGAEIAQLTPTRLKLLMNDSEGAKAVRRLKTLLVGGERFPSELLPVIKNGSGTKIVNVYGPSEATVWCSQDEVNGPYITIGRPLTNIRLDITDDKGQSMPIGTEGEIRISGECVASGYIGRPELTAEKFKKTTEGDLSYSSGDTAFRLMDGRIVFTGRKDGQIKLRGQRTEPGEIEAVMSGFGDISLAAVSVHTEEGRQLLCGYYVSGKEIDTAELREYMLRQLPAYMIPNRFMRVSEIPMTPSGKTDRKKLPPIPGDPDRGPGSGELATETERVIAEFWRKHLHISVTGRDDDFFLLGGDSLGAISVISEINSFFYINLQISDIFAAPRLKELAEKVDEEAGKGSGSRILPAGLNSYRLLPQQLPHYRYFKEHPSSLTYQLFYRISAPDETERDKILEAMVRVLKNEKVLNCRIIEKDGTAYAEYIPEAEAKVEHCKDEKDFHRAIDLNRGPFYRIGTCGNTIMAEFHHIVTDAHSFGLLFDRIAEVYKGGGVKKARLWYGDYAAFFENLDHSEEYGYFEKRFPDSYEHIKLPETETGLGGGEQIFYPVPDGLYVKMKESVSRRHLSMTAYSLCAYAIVLSGATGSRDIMTMLSFQNRSRPECSDIIGMFTTSQPVRITVTGDREKLLAGVNEMLMQQFRCQELPMDMITEHLGEGKLPQIDTAFVFQQEEDREGFGGLPVPERLQTENSIMHLTLFLYPAGSSLSIGIEYRRDKYERKYIDSLAADIIRMLEELL